MFYSCWPSGDTFFVYPNGDPSWRYLNLLNGYQNGEKWRILEAEGGAAAAELEKLGMQYDVRSALAKKDGDFRELVRDTLTALNGGHVICQGESDAPRLKEKREMP